MATYIARRLIQGIVVLLVASLLCFIVFRFMGDPVITLAGRYATSHEVEEVRRSLGLDKPMHVQYVRFLANAAQGNFGISYVTRVRPPSNWHRPPSFYLLSSVWPWVFWLR
jgi:ABC-type dipeptide/oligopeptide/nickel transport system permease component